MREQLARREGSEAKNLLSNVVGYRLGLHSPDPDSTLVRYVGRVYRCNASDVVLLRETISEFNELAAAHPGSILCLSAFPVTQKLP